MSWFCATCIPVVGVVFKFSLYDPSNIWMVRNILIQKSPNGQILTCDLLLANPRCDVIKQNEPQLANTDFKI